MRIPPVAARRLAPSVQYKAINALYLNAPQQQTTEIGGPQPLTRQSRAILTSCLESPNRQRFQGTGAFEGLVRAVDLDARRFEIRGAGSSQSLLRL